MKTTLEWARKQVRKNSSNQKVAYYFFNARASSSLEKSTLGFYRSLVYQLLELYPSLRFDFTSKFALKDPGDPSDSWSRNELQDFLSDMVDLDGSYSLCILVDAVDEGENGSDVRDMINFLVDLSEGALPPSSSLKLRICLSSRHYPHISIKKGLSLVVEDQVQHDRDIEIYVRKKLIGQAKLIGSDSSAKEDLVAEVCRKSASIFLWVVLVVRMLDEFEDYPGLVNDMRIRLKEIPADLNELFAEILKKSDRGIEACIALLQWVTFSMRALTPSELYLATEYSRSPADVTWTSLYPILVPSEDRLSIYITDCSRGLVELTSARPSMVQFIHETVRDYLVQSNGLASLLPALSSNLPGISHEVLKTSCVRYISTYGIPGEFRRYGSEGYKDKSSYESVKEKIHIEMPFINYPVSHVFGHSEQAQKHGISQIEFLIHRISPHGEWLSREKSWWNVFERFGVRKCTGDTTLLYFLVEQGLVSLIEQLLKIPNSINAKCGRYGSALQVACATGSEEIVRCLVANRADVNAICGEYKHALLTAIYTKNFFLVPLLRDQGAQLSQALLPKAFFEMVVRGSTEGVLHLLELGADISLVNSRQLSPLYLAVTNGRAEVALLLMKNGADISADSGLIMLEAIRRKFVNVVRILAQNGFDDNANNGIALKCAINEHHVDMARELIKQGADVNAQGGSYGTALQAACCQSDEAMVRLLIKNGADVNTQGGKYGSALQAACCHICDQIVQLLIENGAGVNIRGGGYGAALKTASFFGTTGAVRLLLENNADVNHQREKYGSALGVASLMGRIELVRLLIEKGAHVNLRGGENNESPIEMAYRGSMGIPYGIGGYSQVIQILRDAGAEEPPVAFFEFLECKKRMLADLRHSTIE